MSEKIDSPLRTPEQIAGLLQVKPVAVRRWLKRGKLEGFKIGRLWRVNIGQLQAFLKENE